MTPKEKCALVRDGIDAKSLSHREREILKLRYGLGDDNDYGSGDGHRYTLEEVSHIFKVTGGRIHQIEAKAIRKLEKLAASKPKETDVSEHTPGPVEAKGTHLSTPTDYIGRVNLLAQLNVGTAVANGRLLAAAFTSYDLHCGARAVVCAEGDLLGMALEGCRKALTCASIDSSVQSLLRDILAKATKTE